jgi:L-lactate dehydrogenase complex protein LldG
MNSRESILRRIRAQPRAAVQAEFNGYRAVASLTRQERAELFCARVAEYRADVVRVSRAAARGAIADAAGGMRVAVSAGLARDLWPETAVPDDQLSFAELDSMGASLTTASVAIAETGTIVLAAGAAEGRRAMTLIPDRHICVVDAALIVESVPEALRSLSVGGLSRRPLTLISGPSATSDIEMQRVEGVHGPRRLVVIVQS